MAKKRTRRKRSEIEALRSKLLKIVTQENRISLTGLVRHYGPSIGVRNTPSDKNLAKRQLDILARSGQIEFGRDGRDLFATVVDTNQAPAEAPAAAVIEAASVAPKGGGAESEVASSVTDVSNLDLEVIKAYARQVEEFSRTLQDQVTTLVRMVEKAAR